MSKAKDARIRKAEDKLIAGHYQVILAPVITEKATNVSEHNQVMFKVKAEASKPLIRRAVEKLFEVKVEAVNTHNRKGKTKRFRGRMGSCSDVKYAIVTLAEGSKIDVSTGVS